MELDDPTASMVTSAPPDSAPDSPLPSMWQPTSRRTARSSSVASTTTSAPTTIWAGTASGGVWKSDDGGVTFEGGLEFTGGNGDYAGASGSGGYVGNADTFAGEGRIDGRILCPDLRRAAQRQREHPEHE